LKIWRYVDLAKFVNMLATRSLYFACTSQMPDPYEGWLPRSHINAMMELTRTYLDQIKNTRDSILAQEPSRDPAPLDAILEDAQRKLDIPTMLRRVNIKFGLNCWHINEDESDAMWRLYGAVGNGIAIESTEDRLKGVLSAEGIIVDRVRYMDLDRDEIEKGHTHYGLFIKRKSFAHEQELRATILLPTPGIGTLVPCDIDALIAKIHISPEAPSFYADTVRYIIERADIEIKAPVLQSKLLEQPGY
jgi:hypothetical protein